MEDMAEDRMPADFHLMECMGYAKKRVLVTGCQSGIGKATAELLTACGAIVYGMDIKAPDYRVEKFIKTDFRLRRSVDDALASLDHPIDALFNCAGLGPSHADSDVIRVNILATRQLTQGVVERMTSGGAIVSVGSIGGAGWRQHVSELVGFLEVASDDEALQWYATRRTGAPNAYAFSKEAIVVWTKQESARLIKRGIRINCTAPGATQTAMLEEIIRDLPASNVDSVAQPIGRRSQPAEQAWPLLMLNSDMATYINGIDLAVDGGATSVAAIAAFPR